MAPSFGPGGAVYGDPVALAASAARTSNGNGGPFAMEQRIAARLQLDVTAASGTTPNLVVTIETSGDGSSWRSAGAFAAATGIGSQRLALANLDRFIRPSWAITGTTPSFTFAVSGEAL